MGIQRLRGDEGERLRALRLRALRDAPDAFSSTFEEAATRPLWSWRQQLLELPTFVAVQGGVDVGMVRGGPYQGRPGAAILLSMWVVPEARGKGLGEALIDAVVAWARAEEQPGVLQKSSGCRVVLYPLPELAKLLLDVRINELIEIGVRLGALEIKRRKPKKSSRS